jgi:(p)ppGpp synthase/HD superfamily hydrolase
MTPAHPLTDRFQEALAWAFTLHRAQPRKGAEIPYFSHLMAVTALVLEHHGTETEAIAALLHDAPEDQGGRKTLDAIRDRFGNEVATIVEGCSDTFERPKPPWHERETAYIEHLRTVADPSTLLVSIADKTHNLERIVEDAKLTGPALWDRFGVLTELEAEGLSIDEIRAKKREAERWYYESLIAVYRERGEARARPLVGRLESALGALEAMFQ